MDIVKRSYIIINFGSRTVNALELNSCSESQFNPFTPRSDEHETSPYNFLTLSSKQPIRIFKLIR